MEIPWVIEPQTKVKHQLLNGYMGGWMSIMFSQLASLSFVVQPKLMYVDGFSGPGEYWTDETKNSRVSGSPLIVAEKANKYLDENPKRIFNILCVDKNEKCVRHLEPLLEGINKHKQSWKVLHGTFEETIKAIFDYLDSVQSNIAPTFFFVDPFGYSGFSMDAMCRILKHPRTELFINFMYYDINRFLGADHATDNLKSLFGTDEYSKALSFQDEEKVSYVLNLYCKNLKEIAKAPYVLPFRINTPEQGTRPRYFMIHASQHIKALRVMKDAMAKTSTQAFRFESIGIGKDRQLDFFEPSDEQKLMDGIYAYLVSHGLERIPYLQIEEWAYQYTPGIARDIKKALCTLESQKGLVIERLPRKKTNTVTEGAFIIRPKAQVLA